MTNIEILNKARVLIVGMQAGASLPLPDDVTGCDLFCIEVACFVLRGEDHFFHCKSPTMLRQARAFAATNGRQVNVVEDYGDGHRALSIGKLQLCAEAQQ